uniref:ATP synthase subunit 8 n=1 Tax=Doliolum nationalis TaxID=76841 RepID=Q5KT41_DOLNA|nr:ATP synthase subunit 8 [Doliolum nationalis]
MPQLDFKSYIMLITLGSFAAWGVLLMPSTIYSVSGSGTSQVDKFPIEK